jgi:hypothetical protein
VSSAQLDLFAARMPHRPYCTDDLGYGIRIRDKVSALRKRYVQVNPPATVGYLVFDVDREGAAFAWDDRNLLPPSWTATNPENGHAHIAYAVRTPVVRTDAGRQKPLAFLAAVQDAMTVHLDADPGYAMFVTKNPLSPAWRVVTYNGAVYDLEQLAECVDLTLARKKPRLLVSGLGRNCDLFDNLRHRAYREVIAFREGGCYQTWWRFILDTARKLNTYAQPLPTSEVQATARSVAKWVWRRFGQGAAVDRFIDRQKARQRRSAAARRGQTSARVVAAVEGLRRAGKRVTVSAVARIAGVSRPTIYRRHRSLLSAVLVGTESVSLAKSDNSGSGGALLAGVSGDGVGLPAGSLPS